MNFVGTARITDSRKTNAIDSVASRFARGPIAPELFQSSMTGPNVGCDSIQLSMRLEDLAKQNDASKRRGTVGSNGRNAPITASPIDKIPRVAQTIFMAG